MKKESRPILVYRCRESIWGNMIFREVICTSVVYMYHTMLYYPPKKG